MLQEWVDDLRWYFVEHRKTLKECANLRENEKVYKTAEVLHNVLNPSQNTYTVRCNKNEVVLTYRITDSKTHKLTNADVDFCAALAKTMIDATAHTRIVGKDVQLRLQTTMERVARAQYTEHRRELRRLLWNSLLLGVAVFLSLHVGIRLVADGLDLYAWFLSNHTEEIWEVEDE